MGAHQLVTRAAQLQTGHGPVVGHSPGVGNPCSKKHAYIKSICRISSLGNISLRRLEDQTFHNFHGAMPEILVLWTQIYFIYIHSESRCHENDETCVIPLQPKTFSCMLSFHIVRGRICLHHTFCLPHPPYSLQIPMHPFEDQPPPLHLGIYKNSIPTFSYSQFAHIFWPFNNCLYIHNTTNLTTHICILLFSSSYLFGQCPLSSILQC